MRTLQAVENPIYLARTERGQSVRKFAADAGVHYQAVYLSECGVYAAMLPVILDHLVSLGYNREEVKKQYRAYIKEKRATLKDSKDWSVVKLPPSSQLHPFREFREYLDFSRAAFGKTFCVQIAQLYRLENADLKSMPFQLEGALRDVGFTEELIVELNERIEESYYGKRSGH